MLYAEFWIREAKLGRKLYMASFCDAKAAEGPEGGVGVATSVRLWSTLHETYWVAHYIQMDDGGGCFEEWFSGQSV